MAPLPSEPAPSAAFDRLVDEVGELRRAVGALSQQLATMNEDNAALRRRLEHSESARADLLAQAQHLIDMLAMSRQELRAATKQA